MAYGDEAGQSWPHDDSGRFRAPILPFPAGGRRQRRPASGRPRASAFPEIDCVRDRFPPSTLAAVEQRATALGVSAERVLIAAGMIDEEAYMLALADWLGWDYEDFEQCSRSSCPLDDRQLIEAARHRLLPLRVKGEQIFVVAPHSARQLITAAREYRGLRLRLTTSAHLNRFISYFAAERLGEQAADALLQRAPELSAGSRLSRWWPVPGTVAALVVGAALLVPWPVAAVQALLATCFLAWLVLRLAVCAITPADIALPQLSDRELPIYTVIAALYRESASVEQLVDAIRALDYPPEKLDVKFAIEPDDTETLEALQRLDLRTPFEIVIAPAVGPRTKPKALNAALPFAVGTFVTVFDAEDRPEPDQLRRAVATFCVADRRVACVQAHLTIDNTDDGWIARLFTAEYATQFDLFLPGLARLGLPLPLGGTSNHFRTDVLREVGAWDAYNVTEDADLGMRLARLGYRCTVLNSSTYEEAPASFGPWLRQRTRWLKGWIQTWAVHMRQPLRLWRELGTGGFLTFQLVVGGSVLTALVHPFFLATMIYFAATGGSILGPEGQPLWLSCLFGIVCATGYLVTVVLALRGLSRRGLLSSAPTLVFIPVHWLMLSLAAWRALIQFWRARYSWEKTSHGLARSSRLAAMGKPVAPVARRIARPIKGRAPERRRAA